MQRNSHKLSSNIDHISLKCLHIRKHWHHHSSLIGGGGSWGEMEDGGDLVYISLHQSRVCVPITRSILTSPHAVSRVVPRTITSHGAQCPPQ